jgi:hypothetical protein
MAAIVNTDIRKSCLYQPGEWEKGGWFHRGQKSSEEVSTKPSGEAPVNNQSRGADEATAYADDPMASEGNEHGDIPEEQARLLQAQRDGKTEPPPDESEKPPA